MRLGLYLNAQHPTDVDPRTTVRELGEQVRLARDLGFSTVMCGHHYLSEPYWTMQNVPLLARLAADMGEMRAATGVLLLTLLNPLRVAEEMATLDAICEGRLVVGIGLGYRRVEDAAFGVGGERGRLLEQKLGILRRLLDGESVTASGPGFSLRDARLGAAPPRAPAIWLAANGDVGVERAARLGDAWLINPHSSLAQLNRQVALFDSTRHAADLGPPSDRPAFREVAIAATTARAVERSRPFLADKYETYVAWGQGDVLPPGEVLESDWARLSAGNRFIIGSPEDCVEQIAGHGQVLGLDELICRVQWPGMKQAEALDAIRLLGEQVLPRLAGPLPDAAGSVDRIESR
jgi:alkanesulfonate monooxygenase SsuD/methylene tetrahydromethanopterin reductase-like flavin-dependent oxidoreductase (luciferase family)